MVSVGNRIGWNISPLTNQLAWMWLQGHINATDFDGPVISGQVLGNLLLGIALMCAAWLVFDPWTQRAGIATSKTWGQWLRRGKPRRAWERYPLVWLGFQQTTGGWGGLLLRLLAYPGLVLGTVAWQASLGVTILGSKTWEGYLVGWGLGGLVVEVAYISAQIFRQEVAGQTWGTLCTLPMSLRRIAYSRVVGTLLPLAIPLSLIQVGGGLYLLYDVRWEELDEVFALSTFFLGVIMFGAHICTLFSVTFDWSAWPLSILLTVGCCAVYFACTFTMAPSPNTWGITVVCLMGLMGLILSGILQWCIGQQLIRRQAEG
jgi:hypothetical protein